MSKLQITAFGAGVSRIMNPTGTANAKIKREREGENIFFRKKLSGELTFTGEDFMWLQVLRKAYLCTKVGFRVESFCQGQPKEEIYVYYSLTDGKWNLKNCTVKLGTSVPGDAYQCVLDGYGKDYNVLAVPVNTNFPLRAKLDFLGNFEFLQIQKGQLEDQGYIDDADTWASFLETNYWIDGSVFNKGYRSTLQIIFRLIKEEVYVDGEPADLSSGGWKIVQDNINKNGKVYAKYAKQPDLYNFRPYRYETKADFTKYPELLQIECNDGFDATRYINASGKFNGTGTTILPGIVVPPPCSPGCVNIPRDRGSKRCVTLLWEFGAFTFNRNRLLLDVVHYLVQQSCPTVAQAQASDISEFFTDATNYATGLPNVLQNILIAAKSDIIGYNSTERASKALISLKTIQDELKAQFQVYWFLDASGKYRLEHYAYFSLAGTVDFTLPKYARWQNQSFTYDKLNMPRFERLKFSEAFNDDFLQGEIEYSGDCVNRLEGQDAKEVTVSKFDNDLENLIVSAENLNREGFVLLVHQNGEVVREEGDVTGAYQINGHLAAANLVKHYYQHGRVLPSGLVNGKTATFKSVIRPIKQDAIVLPTCCEAEVDPFATFVTLLGNNGGLLYTELNLKTSALSVATLHPIIEEVTSENTLRQADDSFDLSYT
jgi:hypothetical protein